MTDRKDLRRSNQLQPTAPSMAPRSEAKPAHLSGNFKRLWGARKENVTNNATREQLKPQPSGLRKNVSLAHADQILHFTIGPVQTFVAEARRTRDLWAGSFLLSWLTGHAMAKVEDLGGEITFPHVANDKLYGAIRSIMETGGTFLYPNRRPAVPTTGAEYEPSLTNHFSAALKKPVTSGDIAGVVAHVHQRWQALAEAVWQRFLDPVLEADATQLKATRAIWDRQIGTKDKLAFWDMAWVLGSGTADHGNWLEQRKSWRAFDTPDEPGDMCRMMGRYQELSGFARVKHRKEQDDFWNKIQESISDGLREATDDTVKLLDLRDTERLCAIAFVKRMFPRLQPEILADVIGWLPESHKAFVGPGGRAERLHVSYRPSTAFLAAAHWVSRANLATSEAKKFEDVINEKDSKGKVVNVHRTLAVAERHNLLPCHAPCRRLAEADGRLFFKSVLQTKDKRTGLCKEPGVLKPDVVLGALNDLSQADLSVSGIDRRGPREPATTSSGTKEPIKVGEPSPYYAVLIMDGDNVGKLIREDSNRIKGPLAKFAMQANQIVSKDNSGSLIYAGGDDVLAMLPIEDALPVAEALRCAYTKLIVEKADGDRGTVSAAIVFAHYEASLSGVLNRARTLLEAGAKEGNGRASLALAIHRTDGVGPEWISTWNWRDLNDSAKGEANIANDIQEIASRGRSLVSVDPKLARTSTYGITSNRFVYGVHDRLRPFFQRAAVDRYVQPIGKKSLVELLRVIGGGGASDIETEDYERLLRILSPQRRIVRAGNLVQVAQDATRLDMNGLLILRFLAMEWRRIETS